MKRVFMFVILALMILSLIGCSRNAETNEKPSPILRKFSITGEMPKEFSYVGSDLSNNPIVAIGNISFGSDDEITLWPQLSPSMSRSGMGNIQNDKLIAENDKELCVEITDDYTLIDNMFVVFISAKTEKLLGYCKLSEMADLALGIDKIRTNGIESPTRDDVFAYPVTISEVDGKYCLISMMDGSLFIPSTNLPEEMASLSLDIPDDPQEATISATKTGVAIFKRLRKESGMKYYIELLSYTVLSIDK